MHNLKIIEDIESLITNEIEEGLYIDYKEGGTLEGNEHNLKKFTKHLSAFANADGGVIIFGIVEKEDRDGIPDRYEPFEIEDRLKRINDWKSSHIHSPIENIEVVPIYSPGDQKKTGLIVVTIPASPKAPHMASDLNYYRRYGKHSRPMYDYEVRETMFRFRNPELVMDLDLHRVSVNPPTFEIYPNLENVGKGVAKHISCKFEISYVKIKQGLEDIYDYHPSLQSEVRTLYYDGGLTRSVPPGMKKPIGKIPIEAVNAELEIPMKCIVSAEGFPPKEFIFPIVPKEYQLRGTAKFHVDHKK